MKPDNMEQGMLEFVQSDALAGFRLDALEVYNWGTFHKEVWRLDLNSRNGLLTGDIGSGKSTLVDAVTTLLVPAQRIAYNKAAGADTRERSLRSYVQGYYKSERSDMGHASKSVALRDHNSFSVILGVFKNQGFTQEVTLAQVFWTKEIKGQPDRFYVVADSKLSITKDFSEFGTDIGLLKKRLKKQDKVTVFDAFPKYGAAFRRRFGIENEQALALFHQTVSMKSVGNLNDFVRQHMLEPFDTGPRIDALIHHFDDLNRAHEAVLKAKHQIERLVPLVKDCQTHQEVLDQQGLLRDCRNALTPFFATHKWTLFRKRLKNLADEQERLENKIHALDLDHSGLLGDRDGLKQAISENGGDRLERIRADLDRLAQEKQNRQGKAQRYGELARDLDLAVVETRDDFHDNAQKIKARRKKLKQEAADLRNERTDTEVEFRDLKSAYQELEKELESLSGRKSNIHVRQIEIRNRLCTHLGVDERQLPFAGELIRVRDDQSDWEGAVERLLHNFGLSLLVTDALYPNVAAWVDATSLNGRLVYYLVKTDIKDTSIHLPPESLVNKLELQSKSDFYLWVERELVRRFNYVCCDEMQRFRKEPMAVTRAGQIKTGGIRHEKNDRKRINDRSQYILGWTNEAKIRALKHQARSLEKQMQTAADKIASLDSRQSNVRAQLSNLDRLGEYRAFSDLDWQSVALNISRLAQEQKELEAASNILSTLNRQLKDLEKRIKETEIQQRGIRDELARNLEKQDQAHAGKKLCESDMKPAPDMDPEKSQFLFKELEDMRRKQFGTHVLTVESCANREKELRDIIQGQINNLDKRIRRLEERIIKNMNGFRRDFRSETMEIDDAVASGPEYKSMLDQLQSDNLPRFESRFKALLNENTIREVANFQSQLARERETIKERIDRINHSLSDIKYNPGRYILLEAQLNADMEIRDFLQQLKACTEGALTGSDEDHYSEGKFLQVRTLIQRFRGREGTIDLDRRWTKKVTDVRNWFVFAASERWCEDHTEYEHYADSGGKSGGQKEKLAYTVLAASLAYQFGLEWNSVRSRTFRFVAIDEAFGRGSDDSTRFSLELFKKLNLQLLIVTPLQKIHIIEPYVSSVGLVYSRDGQTARLRNMSVEEYRQSKERNTP